MLVLLQRQSQRDNKKIHTKKKKKKKVNTVVRQKKINIEALNPLNQRRVVRVVFVVVVVVCFLLFFTALKILKLFSACFAFWLRETKRGKQRDCTNQTYYNPYRLRWSCTQNIVRYIQRLRTKSPQICVGLNV